MGGRRNGFLLEKDLLESRTRGSVKLFIGTSKKADRET